MKRMERLRRDGKGRKRKEETLEKDIKERRGGGKEGEESVRCEEKCKER